MRKFKVFFTGIIVLIFLNACKQFLKDPLEDFSYWTAVVYVKNVDISRLPLDNEGYASIPLRNDYKIKLHIFNEKNHTIRDAVDSNSNKDIIVFEKGVIGSDGTNPPKVGVDYTLKQINQNTLELNLSSAFLERSEWGGQNVSPTITLYNKEGRKFPQKYTFKLRANTPPPALEYKALCKTQDGSKWYYVLCFKVSDMDKTVSTELLHKDIASITVTPQSEAPRTLPLTVKPDKSGFNIGNSGEFLLPANKVEKLLPADITTDLTPDNKPTENWIIYLKTDVEVRGPSKEYTLKLTDEKGLTSPEIKKSTATNKLSPVELYHNNSPITENSENSPYEINTNMAITLQARAKEGASITGTIEKKVLGSNSWTSAGTVSGTTTADFNLPALGDSENEAIYKITLKASAAGYNESESKTFFVKLVKEFVVRFRVVGGNGSLQGSYNGTDKTASGNDTQTLTVPYGGSVTFTATPNNPNQYKVGNWTCMPSIGFTGQNCQASLTVTANTEVSVQFVPLDALTLQTLKIHGQDASAGAVTLPYAKDKVKKEHIVLEFNGQANIDFTLEPANGLTLTEGVPQDLTINVAASEGNYPAWSKTVRVTRSQNNVANLQSFKLNGEEKTTPFASEYTVASTTAKVTDFAFDSNSAGATAEVSPQGEVSIPANGGQQFTITVTAQDGTQNTIRFTVKRKTYNVTFRVQGGNGSLQGSYNGTDKTASGSNSQSFTVPYGGSVTFTATPGDLNQYKVGNWICTPSDGFNGQNGQASLTVTANTEVSVQFVQLSALTLQTLTIHGQNAASGSVTLPYAKDKVKKEHIVLEFNGQTGIDFTLEPANGLTLTEGEPQNLTINVAASPGNYPAWSKTVRVTRAKNDVANLQSFKLNGELKTAPFAAEYTVASTTARVTDCTFDLNSAQATASVSPGGTVNIPANGGTQFTITVKAQNGSTTQTVTFTVKRKTYPVRFSVQGGKGGSLKGVYNGSHQTASGSYIPNLSVPHGESVTFTATPEKGWDIESWTGVSSSTTTATLSNVTAEKTVRVKFKPGEFNLAGGGNDAWKQLKDEAAKPYGAHTILINGEIKATGGNNAGEITLGRNLIIKGKNSAVLDANNQSRIFKVKSGKTLTLENITLKNGNEGAGAGGGVYVDGGTLIMKDSSTITGCSARIGGGVYVDGTFKMQGGAKVDENNEVYLEPGKTITVTGALTHRPAARITPNEYTDGRVLATGAAAERDNFKVTPKNGTEYWRYKKKGDVIKFVKAELKVTFVEIKCVAEHDAGSQGEYYWTMKVNGQIIHERPESNLWKAGSGDTLSINKSFTRSFSYVPAQIPVNIEIWEDDNEAGGDDHIGTTKAKLTYDYDNDRWVWTYDGNQENGNQKKNPYIEINDGQGQEKSFTEEYRHSDGDTDVTMKIKWIDE